MGDQLLHLEIECLPIEPHRRGIGVIAELHGIDGELGERRQICRVHSLSPEQQQQPAQVMGEWRITTELQQPGLDCLFNGLLQPEAPCSL